MSVGAEKQPHELWQMAHNEHPDDPAERRVRYMELMIEAGHVIEKKPGPQPPPPADTLSGWAGDPPRARP